MHSSLRQSVHIFAGHSFELGTVSTCIMVTVYVILMQVVHQLIEKKQAEIRKVHPGLTCFGEGIRRIDVKDIPGICEGKETTCAVIVI